MPGAWEADVPRGGAQLPRARHGVDDRARLRAWVESAIILPGVGWDLVCRFRDCGARVRPGVAPAPRAGPPWGPGPSSAPERQGGNVLPATEWSSWVRTWVPRAPALQFPCR
jgi:hypothetical protein